MKTLVKMRHRLPFGTFVCFFVTNEELDLLGKEAADGRFPPGSQNLGFLEHLPTQAYRDVLLSAISYCHTPKSPVFT